MLKTSSLASVITVTELLYAVQLIYSVNFKTIPLLITASIWYLIVTSVLTAGQYYIERHYARGAARELPPTPWQRIRRMLLTIHAPPACATLRSPPRGRIVSAAAGTPLIRGSGGTPMVLAEGLRKSFGRLEVLSGIDLEVARQEVVCIIGPSGSGKSTLLRCINHLEKINAGRLWVDGELVGYRQQGDKLYELREREICAKRAEIGMVFQQFNSVPAHDRAGERDRGADPGKGHAEGSGR